MDFVADLEAALSIDGLEETRETTAAAASALIRQTGVDLETVSHMIHLAGDEYEAEWEDKRDSVLAISCLLQVCGELTSASAHLLSGPVHYAGAALLRQVVEVEYLAWSFDNGTRDATRWLRSSKKDRLKFFTPARLREQSDGRFNTKDYGDHCERGGHPVPRSLDLLDGRSPHLAQLFLVDLLTHSWRAWDSVTAWGQNADPAVKQLLLTSADPIGKCYTAWVDQDPVYALMCREHPN